MQDSLFAILTAAAMSIGSLHALAPDHWVPFAALARAQGWSIARTARVTALCGFGHVTVSVLLGLFGLFFGVELLSAFGARMETIAGILLVAFGLGYALRGLGAAHHHDHHHHHDPHDHHHGSTGRRLTPWTLFLLFCADPCVAVVPLLFAAAPLGVTRTLTVVGAYEVATIGTMVLLVLPARLAATRVRGVWFERFGDAAAGGVIACIGIAVGALGW